MIVEASTMAGRVDALMLFIAGISLVLILTTGFLIIFFSTRYHYSRETDRAVPSSSGGRLAMASIVVVTGLVLFIFLWGARVFVEMRQPPAEAITMYVLARQWMWKTQHPEGRREINELHIPVGYPVKLLMTSQDVIHSFYVPVFRTQESVLPDRYTTEWFQATQPGTYDFFCAEYCGALHSAMTGRIIAMTPEAYSRWLGGGTTPFAAVPAAIPSAAAAPVSPTPPPSAVGAPAKALNPAEVAAGAALFKDFKCGDCHKPDGTGKGPSLQGVFGSSVALEGGQRVVADEAYIRESILQPNAKIVKGYTPQMPAFAGQLEDSELKQLIAYVESLGKP